MANTTFTANVKVNEVPPVIVDTEFPQYLLDDWGGRKTPSGYAVAGGPSRSRWNSELDQPWPAYKESMERRIDTGAGTDWYWGNWTNAAGVKQSLSDPFAAHRLPNRFTGFFEVDVTALVQRWRTQNRGAYLRSVGGANWYSISGRLSANPPKLVITPPSGTVTFSGGYLARFNITSSSTYDSRYSGRIDENSVVLLHWRDITIPSDMTAAKFVLHVESSRDGSGYADLRIYETDPPLVRAGGGGAQPVLGLAAEVGEANLPGHPDVFEAGDFRSENFFNATDSNGDLAAKAPYPPCASYASLGVKSVVGMGAETSWDVDPTDNSIELRSAFVHGTGRIADTAGLSARANHIKWDLTDPMRQIVPGSAINEMYARVYMMMEEDFVSTTDAIKWGLGFNLRCGMLDNNDRSIILTGNSGTPGTGRKVPKIDDAGNPKWGYEGHSIRGHVGYCYPSGTRYEKYRPLRTMVSNNGPYYGGLYGSEETVTCPGVVLEKGKWHCVEWRLKLNSIVGPYDQYGNGVGVRDGILEAWVDGVKAWRRDNFIFKVHPDLGIQGYWIGMVHGGTIPPAPGEILHYRFNHLATAKRYIGPKV
jgi:hypothetical protein